MRVKVEFDLESDGEVLTAEEAGVQEIMEVPDHLEEDEVADWISDQSGWCVRRWQELSAQEARQSACR